MKSLSQFILENVEFSKIPLTESQNKRFVDAIVINKDNELLILRRANYMKNFRGMWGVVGGSIENNEDSKEAAIRELYEETKIEKSDIKDIQRSEDIDHGNGNITEVWVVKVDDPEIKISKEHAQYKWISDLSVIKGKWMPDIKEVLEKIIENL